MYHQAVHRGYAERSFMFDDVYTGVDTLTARPAISEESISKLLQHYSVKIY